MRTFALVCCVAFSIAAPARAASLKEVYDLAGPAAGYDKYLVLETGVTYTGGLWIGGTYNLMTASFEGKGDDVRIVGHGAVLDLQGQDLCLAYCKNRLDLDDCIILNGAVKFRGYSGGDLDLVPAGFVRHVTFFRPHDYAVRLFGAGESVLVERNLVVDAVDTGWDFLLLTGIPSAWLPTGASFAFSLQHPWSIRDNWSFHADAPANLDPLRHFTLL